MNKQLSTVFIIDDDPLICQAIAWLLETICIQVESFHDAQSFLDVYDATRHGCLLIDVRMPGMSGLELQTRLKELNNPFPIIMISGHGDVPMAVRAMQAGAKDFVLKPFNDQLLLDKIQAALEDDLKREKGNEQGTFIKKNYEALTPRERQIMDCVVAGKLNKQMATELSISMSTVELHRARVMQKMKVKSLADLVKAALLLETS